jgi:hypothetical protein
MNNPAEAGYFVLTTNGLSNKEPTWFKPPR